MSSKDPTLAARLDAFIDFKVKHPRLEEMDQDLMRRYFWAPEVHASWPSLGQLGWGNRPSCSGWPRSCEQKNRTHLVVPVVVIRAKPGRCWRFCSSGLLPPGAQTTARACGGERPGEEFAAVYQPGEKES